MTTILRVHCGFKGDSISWSHGFIGSGRREGIGIQIQSIASVTEVVSKLNQHLRDRYAVSYSESWSKSSKIHYSINSLSWKNNMV